MAMDPIVKEKWIAALCSGAYQQTKGCLQTGTDKKAYCCLGVLCAVQGWDPYGYRKDGNMIETINDKSGDETKEVLSRATLAMLGITQFQQMKLTKMNDGEETILLSRAQHSFVEIAQWIKENL